MGKTTGAKTHWRSPTTSRKTGKDKARAEDRSRENQEKEDIRRLSGDLWVSCYNCIRGNHARGPVFKPTMEQSLVGACPMLWFKMGNSSWVGNDVGDTAPRRRAYSLSLGHLAMRRGRVAPVLTLSSKVLPDASFSVKERGFEKKDPLLG